MLGLTGLGCAFTGVPPDKRAYPLHRHQHRHPVWSELFYILSGNGEVRLDQRTFPVRPGDLIANPPAQTRSRCQHRQGGVALPGGLRCQRGRYIDYPRFR